MPAPFLECGRGGQRGFSTNGVAAIDGASFRSEARAGRGRRANGGPPATFEKFLGWCVHGYTALGLVAAGLIAVLLVRGEPTRFAGRFS